MAGGCHGLSPCHHGTWPSLVKAPDWGSGEQEFKSPRPDKTSSGLGAVVHEPRLSGVVCHRPRTRKLRAWGAWSTSPVYRGLCATGPKRRLAGGPRPGPGGLLAVLGEADGAEHGGDLGLLLGQVGGAQAGVHLVEVVRLVARDRDRDR